MAEIIFHQRTFSLSINSRDRSPVFRQKFDRIIGNPPWGDQTLKRQEVALKWVEESRFPVGDNQLVQPFLYRAPQFCAQHGEVAMLAPTKSTLLVSSDTQQEFRQKFFALYHVRVVVNFSALVYELFSDSLSPSVALFYQPEQPAKEKKLIYATPKPSLLSQSLGAIVIDSADRRYLEREALRSHPALWNVALWGTPRDAGLIERLQLLPHLARLYPLTGQKREGRVLFSHTLLRERTKDEQSAWKDYTRVASL